MSAIYPRMVKIIYAERACDICGSRDHAEITTYRTKARTRAGIYEWRVRNVVCRGCGFAFVSPTPTEQSLAAYYAGSFPFWRGETVEFSIARRLEFLRRHSQGARPETFVEIGPNATEGFRAGLAPLIGRYVAVEPNVGCSSDYRAFGGLPAESADMIAAYFVLEHVADPAGSLASFSATLKIGGRLIVEVPDLYGYNINPAGISHFEHVTHFSRRSLAVLAARVGLELVEASEQECSRPYGFVAAFRKSGAPIDVPHLAEYATAQDCMVAGAKLMSKYWSQLDDARRRITRAAATGATVVFWAANKPCADLLDGLDPPKGSVFVDSDPDRSSYLDPLPVVMPDRAAAAIARADLFVIGTELHAAEILHAIEQRRRGALSTDQYIVLSPGFVIGHGPREI